MKKPITEHQEWLDKLLHSGLNPFTMKEFAERYLYIESICSSTKCEHEWVNEKTLKVGELLYKF